MKQIHLSHSDSDYGGALVSVTPTIQGPWKTSYEALALIWPRGPGQLREAWRPAFSPAHTEAWTAHLPFIQSAARALSTCVANRSMSIPRESRGRAGFAATERHEPSLLTSAFTLIPKSWIRVGIELVAVAPGGAAMK